VETATASRAVGISGCLEKEAASASCLGAESGPQRVRLAPRDERVADEPVRGGS